MPRPSRGKQIVLGALNITAAPHPAGTYRSLLERAADKEVELWGFDLAKITTPEERRTDPNILVGEILVWTRVDREGAWIDKETNSAATEEKKEQIDIPELLEPNFRAFTYAFVLDRHRLIFESRNEFGHRLGHGRVERLFRNLLTAEVIGEAIPEINITVIPEDDTVQKILAIPKLRRLHIHLQKSNPDEVGDDAARLLAQLESQGAKSQDVILVKAPKLDSLSPNADTQALARVASENGYVKGRGIDAEGNPVDESTKEYPKSVPVDVAADQSARVRFLHAITRLF